MWYSFVWFDQLYFHWNTKPDTHNFNLNLKSLTFLGLSWQSWNWDLHANNKISRQLSILILIKIWLFAELLYVCVSQKHHLFLKTLSSQNFRSWEIFLRLMYMQKFSPMTLVHIQSILLFTGTNSNMLDRLLIIWGFSFMHLSSSV